MPEQQSPAGGIFGVVPGVASNVEGDFHTDWKPGAGGIRPAFRDGVVNPLVKQGYKLGLYDFNRGHHYAPNDPHLDGRAMDVDTVNGSALSGSVTPEAMRLAASAMAMHGTRIGVGGDLYNALKAQFGDRVFQDSPDHMHIELSDLASAPAHEPPPGTPSWLDGWKKAADGPAWVQHWLVPALADTEQVNEGFLTGLGHALEAIPPWMKLLY